MGLRISIGAIIAVLLGGTGYFAQQSQSTKELLQEREIELSKEKESSAKLKSDIQRFKGIEQKVKGLESRFANVSASAKTRMEELSNLVAEKNTAIEQDKAKLLSLATALKENQTALENERKARAEAEKANQQNTELAGNQAAEIKRLDTQAKEMSRLITEKSADIKQRKAQIRSLKVTLDIINGSLENERKARANAEKANQQNIQLAGNRAEEIKRLDTQAEKMSRLIAEKSADIEKGAVKNQNLERTLKQIEATLENERKARAEEIKGLEAQAQKMSKLVAEKSADIEQEKTKAKKLERTLKQIQTTLDNERKMRAEMEKSNRQNVQLASTRARDTKRLEKVRELLQTQVRRMRQLIAMKSADIEQEKARTQKLELALKQIQAALDAERKRRAKAEKASQQSIKLASERAAEIKRLEKARERLETQVRIMRQLIKAEQARAKKLNVTSQRKAPAKAEKSTAQKTELAQNRAAEMKRLEKTREILNTQVQAMSRLIAEKNSTIEKGKTKTQNLELALEQTRKTLDIERKTRTEAEKAKTRNAELARKRAEELNRLGKARELLQAQVQEMSQLIAEKTSVADLIRNKLNQTNLSLAETIKKHTLAIARSKVLEKRAREEAERAKKLESDLKEMDSKFQEQSITLRRTKDLLRVTFVNNLLFDLGSARIRKKGSEVLSKIAEFLGKQKDKMIQVEGHTDNRPIKGNLLRRYPSNWELSFARAIAIVKFLESKNISPERMSATGYSFYRPVANNDTKEGRAKNRRTEILLSSPRVPVEEAAR